METPGAAEGPRATSIREAGICEQVQHKAVSAADRVHDEQIHTLVQQLFFRRESKPVRYVGFAPVEASTATAKLCHDVARALAEKEQYDVGLIDANPGSVALETELEIAPPSHALTTWPIGSRLWMIPRQSWLADDCGLRIAHENLSRLRKLTMEFDYSVLWCAAVSWLTVSISQTCDGLVLVLTANKTRRLVAAQIKDQLSQAQVPLLGSVLAERRFPVPRGLYRSL